MSQKPTKAQRAAQSQKDKAANRVGNNKGPQNQGPAKKKMIIIRNKNNTAPRREAVAAAYSQFNGGNRPNISSNSQNSGDMRINVKHKEFVADISGSVAFALLQYNINPGLAALFPWLSTLAGLFESYKFRKLKFCYETSTGTTNIGKVFFSVDWDVLDTAPATKTAQMQERSKASDVCWEEFCLNCDSQDLSKFGIQRYVRSGNAPVGSDLKTYDIGMFNLGTQGEANTNIVGELWVEYDIDLMTPNPSPGPLSAFFDTSSATLASPFNVPVFGAGSTLPVTAAGKTITFNSVGQYLVTCQLNGTVFAGASAAGGTAQVTQTTSNINAAATSELSVYIVNVTAPGQTLTVTPNATSVTFTEVRIGDYIYSLG